MRERLKREVSVITSVLALAIGVTACGNKSNTSTAKSLNANGANICVGGLPPVKEVPGSSHSYTFSPNQLCTSPVFTYDPASPYSDKSPGRLEAGQPFEIICRGGIAKTEVQVRNENPEFVGAINLSDIAVREIAWQSIPVCRSIVNG